ASGGRTRRAAVSSFGISGTNVHTIIEEPPVFDVPREQAVSEPPAVPVAISGRSADVVRAHAERLIGLLEVDADHGLVDLGFSLATTRAAFDHRAVVLASDTAGLLDGLRELSTGTPGDAVVRGVAAPGRLAFLFTGQGSQRAGMGRELYDAFPAFAEAFDEVCRHFEGDLKEIVFGDSGLLDQTRYTQAGLFTLEVALYRLLESWGTTPDYLLGHSIGEIAAAHVAGVMSLADACRLVDARGRLMQALPVGGAMLAVEATEEEIVFDERVSIAAVNGPTSIVLSGVAEAIDELEATYRAEGRRVKRLTVSHAFHSVLMEPMLAEFGAVAATIDYAEPRVPVISNLDGEPVAEYTAGYWVRHVREAVRFADGVATLHAHGVTTFVELGPDAVLTAMAQRSVGDDAALIPVLRSGRPEPRTALRALAQVHVQGGPIDWRAVFGGWGAATVELPTYPFQRQRYWIEPDHHEAAATVDAAEARFWEAVESEDVEAIAGTLGLATGDELGVVLPALSAWRKDRRERSVLDSWRYQVSWTPLEA
ncbi:acyltransferase domain-containing protein, partial [Spongiactinospora sp. TRM90649]|uniref:acyltransferase domain-containing protein n=1 Tax=Spongiactinospora sp. TRM90649 TaxID=3031114 RepID=UPI0023F7CD6E